MRQGRLPWTGAAGSAQPGPAANTQPVLSQLHWSAHPAPGIKEAQIKAPNNTGVS